MQQQRWFIFLLGVSVGAVLFWALRSVRAPQDKELSNVRTELEAKKSEVDMLREKLRERDSETRNLGKRIDSLAASLRSSDPTAEREIEDWIIRVSTLRHYFDSHPRLGIPEMHFLNASDWLDAAKEKKFNTEADVRLALATLRQAAKIKAGPAIAELLHEAQKSGAPLPAKLTGLTDDLILKQILARYSIFDPTSPPPGYWATDANTVVVESDFPEPGIDLPQWYTKEGGFGMSGVSDEPIRAMRDAIAEFLRVRGAPPRSVDDVRPYLKNISARVATQDIFKAVQSPAPLD